jgi:phenylacetate-CoA ligase
MPSRIAFTNAAFNRCMLNAFLMSEARMPQYADEINRFRPQVIVAYAGPLLRMAEWLLASGRRVHQPEAILSAAEALHDAQRDVIERAFGCPVFNTYGCREVMLIASECERREGLHATADHLAVELTHRRESAGGKSIGRSHPDRPAQLRHALVALRQR